MSNTNKNIIKTIVQTSRNKPPKDYIDSLLKYGDSWNYVHFNDEEVMLFFKENPISGFENIIQVYWSLPVSQHRSDLFRYYYLYLNGGLYLDTDIEVKSSLIDIIKNYSFTSSEISYSNINMIFNGFIYSNPKNPIIFKALKDAYTNKPRQNYFLFCINLYKIVSEEEKFQNIKIYNTVDDRINKIGFIYNNSKEKILIHHYNSEFFPNTKIKMN